MLKEDRIYLTIPFLKRAAAKAVDGKRWHKELKKWSFPVIKYRQLLANFPEQTPEINQDITTYYGQTKEEVSQKMEEFDLKDPEYDLEADVKDVEIF